MYVQYIDRDTAHLVVSLSHERLQLLGVHEILTIVANDRLANEFKQLAKRVLPMSEKTPQLCPRSLTGAKLPIPAMAPCAWANIEGNIRSEKLEGIIQLAIAMDELDSPPEHHKRSLARGRLP